MAQIIAQSLVLGFELGQAQGILARLRQQLLGGGIGAAVRSLAGWAVGIWLQVKMNFIADCLKTPEKISWADVKTVTLRERVRS